MLYEIIQTIRAVITMLARNGRRIRLLSCLIAFIVIAAKYNYIFFPNGHDKEKLSKPKHTYVYKVPSYIINDYVSKTRAKLKYQLSDYNFSLDLDDLVMESGGRPLRSLIVSTWKSGTTFLAELLNAIPGSYYFYEPLIMYGIRQIRDPREAELALNTIKALLMCNYETLKDYLEYAGESMAQFRYNVRVWQHCKFMKYLCFDSDFMSQLCMLFPFQVMKVVRLRLRPISKILDDKKLKVKLIFLIRDPRGVLQSRRQVKYCDNKPDCNDPKRVCNDMLSDYVAASELLLEYPGRIMVIRYEELAMKPYDTSMIILKFLGHSVTGPIYEYLNQHTNHTDLLDTYRISRNVPYKWKNVMNFEDVNEIQMACKLAMEKWGYRMAFNETHMKSKNFDPLDYYKV